MVNTVLADVELSIYRLIYSMDKWIRTHRTCFHALNRFNSSGFFQIVTFIMPKTCLSLPNLYFRYIRWPHQIQRLHFHICLSD